ncbi:MAG: superfamily protein [Firmicutes bacterium]|nr:superfamily protein [Bacillota bacterium]
MKTLFQNSIKNSFNLAALTALTVGTITIILVFSVKGVNVWLHPLASFLGGAGNDIFLIAANALLIGWAWRKKIYSFICMTLWLDILVGLSVQVIKLIELPPWTLRPTGMSGGFPSGHATHSFAIAFVLTLVFPRLAWFWYLCAAAISWSRVETFAHTNVQIAAGVLLGIFIGFLLISRWLRRPEAAKFFPMASTSVSPMVSRETLAAE